MIAARNNRDALVRLSNLSQLASHFLPTQRDSSGVPGAAEGLSIGDSTTRRKVLVVDDVSDVTEMLSVLLTHAGYEVATASSAQEAMTLAEKTQFDLIVSDIGMPEMNGYELARALRTQEDYEAVPMVAVTGYSMFDDRNRSLTAGFDAHVTKPIDPRAFLDLIEQL
jgi:CheY-like chemotaxis protein